MPCGVVWLCAHAINRSIIALARLNYAMAGKLKLCQASSRSSRRSSSSSRRSCHSNDSGSNFTKRHANFVVAKTISIFYGLDHIISIMPGQSIWSERQANNPCPFHSHCHGHSHGHMPILVPHADADATHHARTRRRSLCVPPYHVHASALKAATTATARQMLATSNWQLTRGRHEACGALTMRPTEAAAAHSK